MKFESKQTSILCINSHIYTYNTNKEALSRAKKDIFLKRSTLRI